MEIERPIAFYAALATAAIAVVLMWRLSRSVQKVVPAAAPATGAVGSEEFLLKFVMDAAGERRGETVAVDGDRLILKTPGGFASLPASRLAPDGANLRLQGEVDWDEARKAGEEWRARSYKEITYTPDEVPKEPA